VEEYLHEESRVLPTATELNRFSDRISALSLGLDRIAARQAQLRDRLASRFPAEGRLWAAATKGRRQPRKLVFRRDSGIIEPYRMCPIRHPPHCANAPEQETHT